MAETLSSGIIKPEPGDSGRIVFAALELLIDRVNTLSPQGSIGRSIQLNTVASQWTPRHPSGYETTVSWTTDFDGRRAIWNILLSSSNERVNLRYKANTNNLVLYTNDNNIALTIIGQSI